jgi:hypothetical protein
MTSLGREALADGDEILPGAVGGAVLIFGTSFGWGVLGGVEIVCDGKARF